MGGMFGSYWKAMKGTFTSELLSMNCLMGGMFPVSALAFAGDEAARNPAEPLFWFRMSLALMVGALAAYPMNYWLVAHHLKHGMMTVRRGGAMKMEGTENDAIADDARMQQKMKMAAETGSALYEPSPPVWVMTLISFAVLFAGAAIALILGGHG
ncbi:hypothetical protein A7A08_01738 [Methyloligella halotolerans]|uniref:DUF4396 domain-containing protein n=1 Tax=Methyloligella halotolerans TaxID=1177755 RepID=A0A1E2RZP7_9HYPH|nr:DUF4396 domain-containing protein [Methyloligella halotolerans]ODA67703.1 hypothetical protein A7A08_01738 [Methyloligella halotolerans]